MRRLRAMRFRSWILPVLLAALAARVFMPTGFMVGGDAMPGARIAMCTQDRLRRERIALPDRQMPGEHRGPCKHCGAPILGTPFASFGVDAPTATPLMDVELEAQLAYAPLLRSQEARAPPHA